MLALAVAAENQNNSYTDERIKMHRLLATLCIVILIGGIAHTPSLSAQDGGAVKGIVVDQDGEPIAHATVRLLNEKWAGGPRANRVIETNNQGEFAMTGVPWGNYAVLADKEEDAYPDTELTFYSNGTAPRVMIGSSLPIPYVTVKLGPKAGFLEITSATNTDTGAAVRSATLTLRRADNPEFFVTMSAVGPPPIPIPSGTDVTVEVSAPGYRSWTLLGNDGKPERMRLTPGEIRKMSVQMQPEAR
ncbi:MAG: carboxypeptidase regulatory-like domain-containing protein [Candidatus Korobacteraceae bacterium]